MFGRAFVCLLSGVCSVVRVSGKFVLLLVHSFVMHLIVIGVDSLFRSFYGRLYITCLGEASLPLCSCKHRMHNVSNL